MDMGGQDKFDPEKGNEDSMKYHSPNMSSDWQFSGPNLTNTSMGLMPAANPMAVCTSSSSSASMVESFCPNIWDPPTNSQNLRFCDINVQNNASTSNTLGFRKGDLGPQSSIERTLDMGWTPPNSILKGGMFVPTMSQFPDDSGFIERAARFSCFGGGNFGAMMNLFSIPESLSPYSGGLPSMQGPQEGFGGKGVKSLSCGQSQENEMNMAQDSKDISLSVENRVTEGIPLNNDEAKQGVGLSGNESDEAGFSGGGQEEQSLLEGTCGGISAKGQGSKKRKRIGQDTELDQVKSAPKQPTDQKGDQNPTSTSNRPSGRNGKSESQASDSLKEDYIHIRARRGQATNSHSLAERVRREKISERMKFLQDLVPGCSKVTGKAVMLDEIINYVQSLQRQVEFLSMKLATVNPRLDFNIEGLLAKDMLQSRACSSSTLGFSPDMTMLYPPLHPSQPGLIQACLPGMGNSSDVLRRTISSQLASMSVGYKEPSSQVWEDELHNVVQMMGYNSSAPFNSQDLSGSLPTTGHMKAEP